MHIYIGIYIYIYKYMCIYLYIYTYIFLASYALVAKWNCAKMALVTIMRCWSGVVQLTADDLGTELYHIYIHIFE
jgi:hypothetical protein